MITVRSVIIILLTSAALHSQPPTAEQQAALRAANEQDQKKMLDILKIDKLRRGANGSNPKADNAANYDESKANPYPDLPDPLIFKNGKKVKSKADWTRRRAEIVEDFDREIYGRVPPATPNVKWEITATTNEQIGETPVIKKQLTGHVGDDVNIQLVLVTPANASGPVPVIMEFGFNFPPRPGITPPPGPTWQEQVLARGWGYAILTPVSIQADNGAGLTKGIIGLVNKGEPRSKPDDWGALRAWAWGASRALDYFETDRTVNARQVGVEGHSRYGKAAVVAMAYDKRFAIGFISSSGEGGVKIHRRNWGELVENVAAQNEYHWMAGNFMKYAGPLTSNDLPVDSHELLALCAPRPVFISAGATNGDGWVDAKGMFLAAAGAGPVYKLLGKKDMGTSEFPAIEIPLTDGGHRLPPACRRSHARAQLAHVSRLRQPLSEHAENLVRSRWLLFFLTIATLRAQDPAAKLLAQARTDLDAGKFSAAIDAAQQSAALFRLSKDNRNLAASLRVSGLARLYAGAYSPAVDNLTEALALSRQLHDFGSEIGPPQRPRHGLVFSGPLPRRPRPLRRGTSPRPRSSP